MNHTFFKWNETVWEQIFSKILLWNSLILETTSLKCFFYCFSCGLFELVGYTTYRFETNFPLWWILQTPNIILNWMKMSKIIINCKFRWFNVHLLLLDDEKQMNELMWKFLVLYFKVLSVKIKLLSKLFSKLYELIFWNIFYIGFVNFRKFFFYF